MEIRKNDFLRYILEDALCYYSQIEVINKYRDTNAESRIYLNDENGIEDMLDCTDKFEIVRALSYGDYQWAHEFVKFNDYGNIESFDALWDYESANIDSVIVWLTEGDNNSSLRNAYAIIDEDEPANIKQHFVDEVMEILDNEDASNIRKWIECKEISAEDIFRNNWKFLIANYKEWKKVDDWLKENGDE